MSRETGALGILGRGTSCTRFAEFSHLFSTLYIANTFDREIDTIGVDHFQGKHLVHFQGKGFDHKLSAEHASLFDSVTVTQNYASQMPEQMRDKGYPVSCSWPCVVSQRQISENHEQLMEALNRDHAERTAQLVAERNDSSGRIWPTIGLYCIEHALRTRGFLYIYLFGFDFYESDYVDLEPLRDKQTPVIAEMMKYHLTELIREFSGVQFFVFTNSSFDPDLPNCTLR